MSKESNVLSLLLALCLLLEHSLFTSACYSSVTASVTSVSVYGGEAVTLTLNAGNSCGFVAGATGTAVFEEPGGARENGEAEALDGTRIICITPQFQRLGRVKYTVAFGSSFNYVGYILVVENPRKTLDLSSSGSDTVRISWDTGEFGSSDTLTLYVHDMGAGLSSTRWQDSILIQDDIPNSGYVDVSASVVLGKRYYAGSFYIGYKGATRPKNKKRVYCGVRRFHERFWKDQYYDCQKWEAESPDTPDDTNPCPPTEGQARQDARYIRISYDVSFYHASSLRCYVTVSPGRQFGGKVCCYQTNGEAICASTGRGGYTFYRSPHDYYWQHFRNDIVGWFACCTDSQPYSTGQGGGGGGTGAKQWLSSWRQWLLGSGSTRDGRPKTDRCRAFYTKRVKRCGQDWQRPRRGRGRGDPHITTFDGFEYTFNGHGDYWMVKHPTCSVQARMQELVPRPATGTATIFTDVAMRCDAANAPIIVHYNKASNSLEVYIGSDETPVPLDPSTLPLVSSGLVVATIYNNVTQPNDAAFSRKTIVLSAGADDLVIEVGLGVNQLTFVSSASSSYDGQVLGLAGNSNGNADDDLRPSNNTGTPLDKMSNLEAIHKQFGETWRVLEAESFFPYKTTAGSLWPPYIQVNLPLFTPSFTAPTCTAAQAQTCGSNVQCCFDLQVTGDSAFAVSTSNFDHAFSISESVLNIKVKLCQMLSTAILGAQQELAAYTNGASYQKQCPEGQTAVGVSTTVTCQDGIWVDLSTCVPQVLVDKFNQATGKNSTVTRSFSRLLSFFLG